MEFLFHSLEHAFIISVFVFAMMVLVDYFNVLTNGRMSSAVKGGRFRQYFTTSFLGSTPGCLGAFMTVSFYLRGLVTFGAIVGCMVATSGDAAFVMLAMFPRTALLIFGILFVLGILAAAIADPLAKKAGLKACEGCDLSHLHEEDKAQRPNLKAILENLRHVSPTRLFVLAVILLSIYGVASGLIWHEAEGWVRNTFLLTLAILLATILTVQEHYFREHMWEHIFKGHLWKIFLWTFAALAVIEFSVGFLGLGEAIGGHVLWILLLAALVGLIPDSGPHLIFVAMFAKGLIPFSVLLTSAIVQDGHGILPLLSYSVKDSVRIKVFNLAFGLAVGLLVYLVGL